jgi:hypothetical protein
MLNRRSFLAALFAPAIARLALAAGREPKLLKGPAFFTDRRLRIAHGGIQAEHRSGHLYVRHFDVLGQEHWTGLGEVTSMRL